MQSDECQEALQVYAAELDQAAQFVQSHAFSHVALQLGDKDLKYSSEILESFKTRLRSRGVDLSKTLVFALADSTYNPLEVDEVAAAHLGANCVLHFGRSSLSPVTSLPAYMIFGERPLDVPALLQHFSDAITPSDDSEQTVLLLDQPYLHLRAQLQAALPTLEIADASARALFPSHYRGPQPLPTPSAPSSTCCADSVTSQGAGCCDRPSEAAPGGGECCATAAPSTSRAAATHDQSAAQQTQGIAGYVWKDWHVAMSDPDETAKRRFIWVGSMEAPALRELQMVAQTARWVLVEPASPSQFTRSEGLAGETQRLLKRRYFLLEKARTASIVGILVGTLGVAGFAETVRRIRRLAEEAGKKTYTVLVGKPNPAKLANFPEVEVWVHVASGQGVLLDSRDYLAPVITVFEAELALRDMDWPLQYRMGLEPIDADPESAQKKDSPRFSLLTGSVVQRPALEAASKDGAMLSNSSAAADAQLALATDRALQLKEDRAKAGGGQLTTTVTSAAEYLVAKRTFVGLETPAATGAEKLAPQMAIEGLSGRAAAYQNEGSNA